MRYPILATLAAVAALSAGAVLAGDGLNGTTWAWDKAPDAGGPGVAAQVATLRFGDGTVEAFLGCNSAPGRYTLQPDSFVTIELAGKTKMLCSDMIYEDTFFGLLDRAARMVRDGADMKLLDANGEVLAHLVRQ